MAQATQARGANGVNGINGGRRSDPDLDTTGRGASDEKTHVTASGVRISRGQLLLIMAGVMLGLLLSALDQTIVGPALFKIVKDLQGLEHYSWVTTGYLLTSTIVIPIVGKLSDIYGRKWFFVAGMIVFVLGSVLSGQASGLDQFSAFGVSVSGLTTGMAQLIAFRALQGIGGGMITANAFTVIADLVAPAERGRWQGLFGAVFGLASVVGPTVGGYITDNIGWRWVFYVNVPIGILAVAVVIFTFPHLQAHHESKRHIDWFGAATLVGSVTPILVALSLGGSKDFPWNGTNTLTLFAVGGVFLVAFIVAELVAKEPILPLDLFKNRIFMLSMITMALVGIGMFGAIINLPLFIQGVQGASATTSGNAITPMMFSLIIVSIVSGQILSRTGRYRVLGIVGTLALAGGMFLLSTMAVDTPTWQTVGYMLVIGLGLGIAMPIYTVIVQNAMPVERLGVVTAATTFFRTIGGTIGIAVLGGVVNNRFSSEYMSQLPDSLKNSPQFGAFFSNLSPQALVSPDTIAAIGQQLQAAGLPAAQISAFLTAIQAPIKPALAAAVTQAFLFGAIIVGVAVLATALIPEIPLRRSNVRAAAVEGAEFAVGVDESAEAEAPVTPAALRVPVAAYAATPVAPVGSSNGAWSAYRGDLGGVLAAPAGEAYVASARHAARMAGSAPGYTSAHNGASGASGGSDLLWGALGLTLSNLAREAQSPNVDPHLVAALSQVADGRYPHSWSAEQRARAVAHDTVTPLAAALLRSYVGAYGSDDHTLAPVASNGAAGQGNGYAGNGQSSNGFVSNGPAYVGNGNGHGYVSNGPAYDYDEAPTYAHVASAGIGTPGANGYYDGRPDASYASHVSYANNAGSAEYGHGAYAQPWIPQTTDEEPTRVQPRKKVRVSRKLVVDGHVIDEHALEDFVPLDADTEAAAARLRARLDATYPATGAAMDRR
jgi:EmrB/QacA subfamily drug resistance transporter